MATRSAGFLKPPPRFGNLPKRSKRSCPRWDHDLIARAAGEEGVVGGLPVRERPVSDSGGGHVLPPGSPGLVSTGEDEKAGDHELCRPVLACRWPDADASGGE
jgi:hypothetical protein